MRRICFIGGARYRHPAAAATVRKFQTLRPLGAFWVIGFAESVWPRRFTDHGVTFYLLPGGLWPVARYVLMFVTGPLLCGWCIIVHGVRIIVAQSPYEAVPAALAKAVARLAGVRVALIVESHGDFESSLFLQRAVGHRGLYEGVMRWGAARGARAADLLRAVSSATGQQLLRWAGPRPLVTFPTWTDLDVFFAAAESRRPADAVLYAGVLTPLKGVDVLIDATAAAGGPALTVAGATIDPDYAAALRRRAEAALPGRVTFIGHVGQAELARHLAAARVFVLPSRSEGLPRVVLEAMAVGVPVIATSVGGIPELIDDGVTGWLIPPGDVHALATRLRWIAGHPEEAEAVGRAGREAVRRRFSVDRYAQGYADLFARADAILGTSGNGAGAVAPGHRQE
ncbi:MAG TPA: glycosyltransferase [bacterium]|nr:glycosyltransferase [bacterium]